MKRTPRRHFLQATLATPVLATLSGCTEPPETLLPGQWRNWSGAVHCTPRNGLKLPADVEELAAVLKSTKGPVRVVGAGHSFSALVPTDDTLISLEQLTGIVSHDAVQKTATIRAGTRLYSLGEPLARLDQALSVQPDIDLQSLGGVLSTCSHGPGAQHYCLPNYLTELTLVTADGTSRTVSASQEPEIFSAARVSLGALGVLAEVTLRNRGAYMLQETTGVLPLDEVLEHFAAWQKEDRHTEFFAFPRGETAFTKRIVEVPAGTAATVNGPEIEDGDLGWASEMAMKAPWTIPMLQRFAGWFVPNTVRVGPSYHIFPTVRQIPFNEMEYAVPAELGPKVFREVAKKIRDADLPVFFPLEYRHVGGDDLWLSPYHSRESVTISVHQYHKQDHVALFKAVEPIFLKYGGRPHWGKWHSLTAKELAPMYPHWADFHRVRMALDPQGKFLNPHLKQLFGVA